MNTDRAPLTRRARRRAGAALAALAVALLPSVSAQAEDPPLRLSPVRVIGGPGHAGLYAWGVAARSDGSILVSDYWNYRVQHYSKDGALLGTAVGKDTHHEVPYDLAVDTRDDSLYIGDADTATVDKYDRDGNYVRSVGGFGTFEYPAWVEVDSSGRLAVADGRKHKIAVYDDRGTLLYQFGTRGTGPGQFENPRGMAFSSDGRLFVADSGNMRIQSFVLGATSATFSGEFAVPGDMRGLAINQASMFGCPASDPAPCDVMYLVNTGAGKVQRYGLAGEVLHGVHGGFGDGRGRGIAVDGDGDVWVADMPQFEMREYSGQFNVLKRTVPDPAEPPPPGRFAMPGGVAVDASGNIAVADTFNFRVQTLDSDGNFLRQWGFRRGGGEEFGLNYPKGIAVDRAEGTIILANTDGKDIRKYGPDGSFVWLVAGVKAFAADVAPDGTVYAADFDADVVRAYRGDTGARIATLGAGHLQNPTGISLDPDGSIWVANRGNSTITHLSATGARLGAFGSAGTADDQFAYVADVESDAEFVYVADQEANRIKVWRKDGTFVASLGTGGPAFGGLAGPTGLDLTPEGRLYVAQQTNERITEFAVLRPGEATPPRVTTTSSTTTTVPPTTTTTVPPTTTTTVPPTTTTTVPPTTTTTAPATTSSSAPTTAPSTTSSTSTTVVTLGPASAPRSGYWMLGARGAVYPFGDAAFKGSPANRPAVDIEPTPSGNGYWILDRTGTIFSQGDAVHPGGSVSLIAGEEATSLSAAPDGRGLWVFTNRGRVVALGTARHLGDTAELTLNGPVLDSVATPSGKGYYMVAADGGIFTFGDARFWGSMGGKRLNAPVESLVPDPDGTGYWLVATDGGTFSFEAPFRGSLGGQRLNAPVTGMVAFGNGYLMVATDGGIFNFSDRPFTGSLGATPPAVPITAVAVLND